MASILVAHAVLIASLCFVNGQSSDSCKTLEGKPGKCIGIHSCPHLASLVKADITADDTLYIRNSRCEGPEKYSVCCGPPRAQPTEVLHLGRCSATLSALLPDHKTECCGVESSSHKIYFSNVPQIDQYPWLALIEYVKDDKVKTLCSGSLISGRYVLTAAHCVTEIPSSIGKPTNIRLGEYNKTNEGPDCIKDYAGGEDCSDGTTVIPIEKITIHPGYYTTGKTADKKSDNIALIKLAQKAPFTDFIRPICLPNADVTKYTFVEQNMTHYLKVAGWGSTSKTSSGVKLHNYLPYVSNEICEQKYKSTIPNLKITSTQLCVGGDPNKDACITDSGGPLVYENGRHSELLGVLSFGPTKCNRTDIPDVYTKVYEYYPWIRDNIEE